MMDEISLQAIIRSQIDIATGHIGGEITEVRRQAMEYYHSDLYGNELEGRSQVVTSEVQDTVESILPDLIQMYAASDEMVRFDPEQKDDVKQAEQATRLVNYVFTRMNPGFTILYDIFKDALVQINGVAKVYWDETQTVKRETVTDLTEDEMTQILTEEGVELVEHTEKLPEQILDLAEKFLPKMGEISSEELEAAIKKEGVTINDADKMHDIVIKRRNVKGRPRVEVVPPEEFLINRRAKDVDGSLFVAHKVPKTVTELIQMGFD